MTDAGVRVRTVAAVAVVSAALCWLLLTLWRNASHDVAQIPWVGLVPLLLVTGGVLAASWQVRRYARAADARTAARRRISAERARGTLVAAQASALGGAALLGWYVGHVLVHLPNADVESVRALVIRAAVSALAALVLSVAGLVAQAWCRVPPGRDDDTDQDGKTQRERGGDLAYG